MNLPILEALAEYSKGLNSVFVFVFFLALLPGSPVVLLLLQLVSVYLMYHCICLFYAPP